MKKTLIGGIALLSASLLLAGCSADTNSSKTDSSSKTEQVSKSNKLLAAGEVIGNFNSESDEVVGATKPGDEVKFYIPMSSDTEYLHFAFMHAGSGDKGWYFAPSSEDGIKLSKSDIASEEVDITDQISLFMAPNASTSDKVTKDSDDGKLKYASAEKFLKATVVKEDDVYKVTIKNISSGDYETAFSSGVWGVSESKMKAFDHKSSESLTKLATMGHRDGLYKEALSEEK
ncbi:hypothetical protein [Lactococcus sp. dk322]|uniref:hypothetical protein n=1 Tax=Lactococcus sp. dk322 TaxID=2603290 RepID=UPI0011CA5B06|nr:hypothetical protein [Lactococcus sp. dk322]TXK45778.1 hypothetical protein FVP43_11400 [Lactococcus sp. dk322]